MGGARAPITGRSIYGSVNEAKVRQSVRGIQFGFVEESTHRSKLWVIELESVNVGAGGTEDRTKQLKFVSDHAVQQILGSPHLEFSYSLASTCQSHK